MDFYKQREQLGVDGEKLAMKHLQKLGYGIIDTNFRCKGGEIDLIAFKKREVFFIEVKSRTSASYGDPLEAVHLYKQQRISRAAQVFLNQNPDYHRWMKSFLVMVVWISNTEERFELIPHAFDFCGGY